MKQMKHKARILLVLALALVLAPSLPWHLQKAKAPQRPPI